MINYLSICEINYYLINYLLCIILYAMSYPPRAAKPWKPHQSGIGENFSLCGHGTAGMQAVNCKIDSSYAWIEGQCVLMSLFPIDVLGPSAADLIFWVVSIELFLAMHKVRVSACYCAFCTLATDLIFKLVFFQLLPSVHGVRVMWYIGWFKIYELFSTISFVLILPFILM